MEKKRSVTFNFMMNCVLTVSSMIFPLQMCIRDRFHGTLFSAEEKASAFWKLGGAKGIKDKCS